MALATRCSSSPRSVIGFVRKSSAPSFIASTASSISPNAVMRIAASAPFAAFALRMSVTPSSPGIL